MTCPVSQCQQFQGPQVEHITNSDKPCHILFQNPKVVLPSQSLPICQFVITDGRKLKFMGLGCPPIIWQSCTVLWNRTTVQKLKIGPTYTHWTHHFINTLLFLFKKEHNVKNKYTKSISMKKRWIKFSKNFIRHFSAQRSVQLYHFSMYCTLHWLHVLQHSY